MGACWFGVRGKAYGELGLTEFESLRACRGGWQRLGARGSTILEGLLFDVCVLVRCWWQGYALRTRRFGLPGAVEGGARAR